MTEKLIPIGVDDFKDIIDCNGYYVDKTEMIDHLLSNRSANVHLFTRPRRFGKSLMLSMIDAYLNQKYRGGPDRFADLRISSMRPNDPEKNDNIVISISLKDLGDGSYRQFEDLLGFKIENIYERHMELDSSESVDPVSKASFRAILERRADSQTLMASLSRLCSMLHSHHGKKVIVLIDEYDSIINMAHGMKDEHNRIISFMRTFLGSTLKFNESLKLAVLTGVMRIPEGSIFPGVENLCVNDVLSTECDWMYGFTAKEVRQICTCYGRPEKCSEAEEWYGGHRFGNAVVCDPWSIMNYVKSGFVPGSYWTGTSGNSIVRELVDSADADTRDDISVMCSGGSIEANLDSNAVFDDATEIKDALYSVMVMSGYLSAVREGDRFLLSIPNREIISLFEDTIRKCSKRRPEAVERLTDCL